MNFFPGKILSAPNACSVLGATNIDPNAEEIDAHANPMGIIGPDGGGEDSASESGPAIPVGD